MVEIHNFSLISFWNPTKLTIFFFSPLIILRSQFENIAWWKFLPRCMSSHQMGERLFWCFGQKICKKLVNFTVLKYNLFSHHHLCHSQICLMLLLFLLILNLSFSDHCLHGKSKIYGLSSDLEFFQCNLNS